MRFRVHVDGAEHQIVAGADGGLAVDADRFEAKLTRPSADRLMVQVGDKSYEVRVIEGGAETGTYVLELAGERIPVTVTDVSKSGGAAAAAEGSPKPLDDVREGIWAPMPGKIVDVLVEAGDTVEAGDAVVILEAMKMENELRAPRKGTVTSVLVKKGDAAERGQLLVALE